MTLPTTTTTTTRAHDDDDEQRLQTLYYRAVFKKQKVRGVESIWHAPSLLQLPALSPTPFLPFSPNRKMCLQSYPHSYTLSPPSLAPSLPFPSPKKVTLFTRTHHKMLQALYSSSSLPPSSSSLTTIWPLVESFLEEQSELMSQQASLLQAYAAEPWLVPAAAAAATVRREGEVGGRAGGRKWLTYFV
jgi:hypothetical protein